MTILNSTYYSYLLELNKAKSRIKRDRRIIKIITKMIKTKQLIPSQENELQELLKDLKEQ